MIPATYDIAIYRGDTYRGPLITLPDLTEFGGPHDLTEAEVTSDIRTGTTGGTTTVTITTFEVEVVNAAARQVRLHLDADTTAAISQSSAVYDLSVAVDDWRGTPLSGKLNFSGQVTA